MVLGVTFVLLTKVLSIFIGESTRIRSLYLLKVAEGLSQIGQVPIDQLQLLDVFRQKIVPLHEQGVEAFDIGVGEVAPEAHLSITLDTLPVLVVLSPAPDLFTLFLVVANLVVVKVKLKLKDKLLTPVYKLDSYWLVRVGNVEDNGFVPNGRIAKPDIGLSVGLVLEHLDQVLTLLQVLSVNDMHFEL